jgi:putative endonuclease
VEADTRATTGRAGEDAALALYEERGYLLIARNWRCRIGELDLVVSKGQTLVFCEVKARRGGGFGGGYEAVTGRKQAKLRSLAEAFLLATGARPRATRFDVASVHVREGPSAAAARSRVELFEDAF